MEVRQAAIDAVADVHVCRCDACAGNIFLRAAMYNHLFLMKGCHFFKNLGISSRESIFLSVILGETCTFKRFLVYFL